MAKLTLAQLERHLFAAADILRGKMDASELKCAVASARTLTVMLEMSRRFKSFLGRIVKGDDR